VHARYALRRPVDSVPEDGPTRQEGRAEVLDSETLRTLLEFVANSARAEIQVRRQSWSQAWVLVGVAVAAAASVIAAVIQAAS